MDNLLQKGKAAFRAGNHEEARKFVLLALQQNRDDEKAWEWAYNVSRNDKERIQALEQILRINPQNAKAAELLGQMEFATLPQPSTFEDYLKRWDVILPVLNEPLEAWSKRPIDTSDPNWKEKSARSSPFDADKQLREQFLSVAKEIIEVYFESNAAQCSRIRDLLNYYNGVRRYLWKSVLLIDPADATKIFISKLVIFSINDCDDPRDDITFLDEICNKAERAGVEIRPYLEKIADLSSSENKYGMGSQRDMLLRRASRS